MELLPSTQYYLPDATATYQTSVERSSARERIRRFFDLAFTRSLAFLSTRKKSRLLSCRMFFEFRFALIVSCSQGSHRDRGKEEEEEEAKEVTEAEAGGGE